MNPAPWAWVAHAFRRVALPLASYYAVTLALPLANGAALSGAFIEHALVVLIVPPVAVILACASTRVAHALASACRAFQLSTAAHCWCSTKRKWQAGWIALTARQSGS